MRHKIPRPAFAIRPLVAIFALLPTLTSAQTAPAVSPSAPAAATAAAKEEAVVLSPFQVNAEEEKGYVALTALSGTRTNEKLANLPNTISVFTADLMSDLALTDFFGAVEFAAGAENIYNDTGTVGAPVGTRSGNQISFRGIPSVRQLRDGFPWFMPADSYNTERIEFARGPGGLAYGDVDPAGIINIASKRAHFRQRASATVRYDTLGTQRYSIDLNQRLAPRLAVRLNALNSEVEQFRQRTERTWRGLAGAVRWDPFQHGRSSLQFNYERGTTRNQVGHLRLQDGSNAYVRGSGTIEADANPLAPGVQVNGVGMTRLRAPGSVTRTWVLHNGTYYDLTSTATTTYRASILNTGATAATGTDPQNPLRLGRITTPYHVFPDGEDWGGPDNRHDSDFHAYNIEFSHAFSRHFRVLVAHNGQRDTTSRVQSYSSASALGSNTRTVFIDVNRVLPHPTIPGATIPNPRFEQLFVAYAPTMTRDGNDAQGWRGTALWDSRLPFLDGRIRAVANANYRRERIFNDNYQFAFTREEAIRRGLPVNTPFDLGRNLINPIHYLADGNGHETLKLRVEPGVTDFYRAGATTNARYDQTLGSGSLNTLAGLFKERLHLTAGVSRDYFRQNKTRDAILGLVTGARELYDLAGNVIADPGSRNRNVPVAPFRRGYVSNQSYGGVWRVRPWLGLGAGYFESALFTDSAGTDLRGQPRLPRTGEGHDFSLRFFALDERLNATLTRFETRAENNSLGLSTAAVTELNALLPANNQVIGTGDYRDQLTKGWEFEIQGSVTRNWTVRANYSTNNVVFTRFYPMVGPYLAAARAAASAQGLDPDVATQVTTDLIEQSEGAVRAVRRETASLVTRYSVNEGTFRGLAIGTSVRYTLGRLRAAATSAGVEVQPAIRTDDTVLVNPFASYRRKILGRATTFQLNVNNALGLHSEQGNNWGWPRYTDPRTWITSVTVEY